MKLDDTAYMRRALRLALNGKNFASPNPMVGAVIVAPSGRVIGEGWHRICGSAHAEVNAIASVSEADRGVLTESTMYVTLEPCSHYGKTPPCAKLLVDNALKRVVAATSDPFPKVSGRGISMLRDAGIEVEVGVLAEEAVALNRRFFTAHKLRRPFVVLKWARSADGFMDHLRNEANTAPCRFSTPLTTLSTMKLRSQCDAVLTTASTVMADDCRLTVRGWHGHTPVAVLLDRHSMIPANARIFNRKDARGDTVDTIVFRSAEECELHRMLSVLYAEHGITSVLVEAGPRMLSAFINSGLWDVAREEIAPFNLGDLGCSPTPELPSRLLVRSERWGDNKLLFYENNQSGTSICSNGCEKS